MDPIVLGAVIGAAWLLTRQKAGASDAAHGGGGASVGGAEQGSEPDFSSGVSTGAAAASVAPGEILAANNPITGAPTSVGHDGAGVVTHEETGSSGKTPTEGKSPFTDQVGDIVERKTVANTSFVTVGDSDAVLASNVHAATSGSLGHAFERAPHLRTDVVKDIGVPSKKKPSCACVKPPCACAPEPKKSIVEPPDLPGRSMTAYNTTQQKTGTGIIPPQKTTAKDQAKALQSFGPRVGSVW